jgi:hypothetical protein
MSGPSTPRECSAGSSQSRCLSGGTITGIRSWIGRMGTFTSVVSTVQDSIALSPRPHRSQKPSKCRRMASTHGPGESDNALDLLDGLRSQGLRSLGPPGWACRMRRRWFAVSDSRSCGRGRGVGKPDGWRPVSLSSEEPSKKTLEWRGSYVTRGVSRRNGEAVAGRR